MMAPALSSLAPKQATSVTRYVSRCLRVLLALFVLQTSLISVPQSLMSPEYCGMTLPTEIRSRILEGISLAYLRCLKTFLPPRACHAESTYEQLQTKLLRQYRMRTVGNDNRTSSAHANAITQQFFDGSLKFRH